MAQTRTERKLTVTLKLLVTDPAGDPLDDAAAETYYTEIWADILDDAIRAAREDVLHVNLEVTDVTRHKRG